MEEKRRKVQEAIAEKDKVKWLVLVFDQGLYGYLGTWFRCVIRRQVPRYLYH